MNENRRYSIFDIIVFVLFFPVILIGWLIRFIINRKGVNEDKKREYEKMELLRRIAEKDKKNS